MNKKVLPTFKTEAEESAFWQTHDSTDYIDWSKAKRASFPNLKPSTVTISLRLPKILLEKIKKLANKRDVPYQSLLKIFLDEKVQQEEHRWVLREPEAKYSAVPVETKRSVRKKKQPKQAT